MMVDIEHEKRMYNYGTMGQPSAECVYAAWKAGKIGAEEYGRHEVAQQFDHLIKWAQSHES